MSPRLPTRVGSRLWIVTLAAMTAVVALSIDTSLPAQPTFARVFHVSDDTAQLTLSLFVAAFAAAQLVTGYVSDAWGRRRVLLVGLALFTAAGIACAAAPTIEVLLVCRVLAGISAAGPPVVSRAMVRDTQPASEAARLLSAMLAVLAIGPMLAPTIGGTLLDLFGWRAIFGVLAGLGAVLFVIAQLTLVETLPAVRHRRPSARGLVAAYKQFLTTPGTRLPLLIGCASFAGQFAYISDSPFVLMDGYHVSGRAYGIYFGATALALMIGSIGGGRMIRAGRSPRGMVMLGTTLLALGGIAVAAATHFTSLGIAGFLPPMLVYFLGIGMTSPSSTAIAMEPVPEIAGTASAAVGFAAMASGAVSGFLTTKLGGASPRGFSLVVATMGLVAFGLALVVNRRPSRA